ncbi:MAG: DUF371 domain-containing protein [Promethearchaeota archaeon]
MYFPQMMNLLLLEAFSAKGHENVLSTHKTTLEFTKSPSLTKRGNCILGVEAEISPSEFKPETKELLCKKKHFLLEIEINGLTDSITGWGDPALSLADDEEMVFRKSNYMSGRTVLINCSKAARDLKSEIKKLARIPGNIIHIRLYLLG